MGETNLFQQPGIRISVVNTDLTDMSHIVAEMMVQKISQRVKGTFSITSLRDSEFSVLMLGDLTDKYKKQLSEFVFDNLQAKFLFLLDPQKEGDRELYTNTAGLGLISTNYLGVFPSLDGVAKSIDEALPKDRPSTSAARSTTDWSAPVVETSENFNRESMKNLKLNINPDIAVTDLSWADSKVGHYNVINDLDEVERRAIEMAQNFDPNRKPDVLAARRVQSVYSRLIHVSNIHAGSFSRAASTLESYISNSSRVLETRGYKINGYSMGSMDLNRGISFIEDYFTINLDFSEETIQKIKDAFYSEEQYRCFMLMTLFPDADSFAYAILRSGLYVYDDKEDRFKNLGRPSRDSFERILDVVKDVLSIHGLAKIPGIGSIIPTFTMNNVLDSISKGLELDRLESLIVKDYEVLMQRRKMWRLLDRLNRAVSWKKSWVEKLSFLPLHSYNFEYAKNAQEVWDKTDRSIHHYPVLNYKHPEVEYEEGRIIMKNEELVRDLMEYLRDSSYATSLNPMALKNKFLQLHS